MSTESAQMVFLMIPTETWNAAPSCLVEGNGSTEKPQAGHYYCSYNPWKESVDKSQWDKYL